MTDSNRLGPNQVIALRPLAASDAWLGHFDGAVRAMPVRTEATQRATAFVVRPGLLGEGISFEALHRPGHFLRHANFKLHLHAHDGSRLFAEGASFIQRPGLAGTGLSLEALSFPGAFVHARDGIFLLLTEGDGDPSAGSFLAEAAPIAQAHSGSTVRRFALILGADAYLDPQLADLAGCRNDVIDAAVTLIDTGLVAPDDLTAVASPAVAHRELAARLAQWDSDPRAHFHRFAGIHSHAMRPCFLRWAAHDLRQRMEDARALGETPMLFLFWSGHGGLVDGDRLALKLPSAPPGEDLRRYPGLPAAICALPDAAFNRTDLAYDALIGLLGMRKDESVFAVIGACPARSVFEGRVCGDRPADLIVTAGGVDSTQRERYLSGRWRGLLNWSILRVLEQFAVHEGGSLSAASDLSIGQLLQTVRSLVLALQGDTATAWLPQVHGALRDDPELLGRRVGQILSAETGETQPDAPR